MRLPTLTAIDAELARRRAPGALTNRLNLDHAAYQATKEGMLKALADDLDDLPQLVREAVRLEPALRRRLESAIRSVQNGVGIDQLADAVRAGAVAEAEAALQVIGMAEGVRIALRDELIRGLASGAGVGAAVTGGAVDVRISFELINAHAVEWAANRSSQFVTGLTEQQRQIVQNLIAESIGGARDVRATARLLRDTLGLTPRQSLAVKSFWARLAERGDLSDADVARRTDRYAQAQLRRRAETVARTEVLDSLNEGQQSLWHAAKAQGLIDPQVTRRVWIATMDDRLEPLCESLDGTEAELDGTFPGGFARPPAHPRCRCATGLVFRES